MVNPDYEEYAMEMKTLQEAAAAVVARVPIAGWSLNRVRDPWAASWLAMTGQSIP